MAYWRSKVDPLIKNHLEHLINETGRHSSIYRESEHPRLAQLWVALAIISKQLFDINLKLKYLEQALMKVSKDKERKKTSLDKKSSQPLKKF